MFRGALPALRHDGGQAQSALSARLSLGGMPLGDRSAPESIGGDGPPRAWHWQTPGAAPVEWLRGSVA